MTERKVNKEKLVKYIGERLTPFIGATAETELLKLRFKIEIGDFDDQ
jgi:hypothetical protein